MAKDRIEVFTDGACSGNPGPGGWASLLRCRGQERELSGCEARTTNNRMELMAVIAALEALTRPCEVQITTDSRYVKDGVTAWMPRWKANGWRTAQGGAVKNQDLWQRLDQALGGHQVAWTWVRGHSGHPDNERVDQLARQAVASSRKV